MKKKLLLLSVFAIVLVGGFLIYESQKPRSTSHLHGDEEVEDHYHVHNGPFSHDHYHVGIADGTGHSHPHQHPDDHVQIPPEFEDWVTVGHVHDQETVTLFLAKGMIENNNLTVRFSKLVDGEFNECSVPENRSVGRIYMGHKKLDDLLFESTGDFLIHKDVSSNLSNPNATLVFDEIEIESNEFSEIVIPITLN